MSKEATLVAAVGAAIALLAAFGLVTASESTALTTNASSVVSGIIGIVTTVTAIVKRSKGKGSDGTEE